MLGEFGVVVVCSGRAGGKSGEWPRPIPFGCAQGASRSLRALGVTCGTIGPECRCNSLERRELCLNIFE